MASRHEIESAWKVLRFWPKQPTTEREQAFYTVMRELRKALREEDKCTPPTTSAKAESGKP